MKADHGDFDPDEVLLDFSVAPGYPGGAGIIEHVHLSLTELAIKNLAGKPSATVKLSAKNGGALPQWLTEDYLLGRAGLIQRVDIGTAYPQTIKDLLLSNTLDAQNREALFCRELRVRLPLQALEFKIRGLHGITTQGYHYVKALMGQYPADRLVDDQEIVLRPLALCRAPQAAPDPVDHMFIIEPRTASNGPHLLYRPLYSDCLYEYPTRQALLDAIALAGTLQDSVLTWVTDKARRIYAYRAEAQSLRHLAQTLCREAFKQQRPKATNIEYLWRHGFVDINLVKRRTPLKGGGFLTEYAVRDKQKIKEGKRGDDNVLWYAHFHYAKANTPAFEPAFGHLKTKEERLFTRKELIEQARANHREVVNLEKVVIKPPLDRELFLKLEPAQA